MQLWPTFVGCVLNGNQNFQVFVTHHAFFSLFGLSRATGAPTGPYWWCWRRKKELPQTRPPGASRLGRVVSSPQGRVLPGLGVWSGRRAVPLTWIPPRQCCPLPICLSLRGTRRLPNQPLVRVAPLALCRLAACCPGVRGESWTWQGRGSLHRTAYWPQSFWSTPLASPAGLAWCGWWDFHSNKGRKDSTWAISCC